MIVLSVVNSFFISVGEGHECRSIEIRNYTKMNQLNNCTVILGNLAIVLFEAFNDEYTAKNINELQFPLR